MYTDNEKKKKSGSGFYVDIIIKFLLVVLVVFLLVWLTPKFLGLFGSSNSDKNTNGGNVNVNVNLEPLLEQIYADNINTMKNAAKSYFTTERLPKNYGDETKLTLQEMLDLNLLLPLVDRNGELCDANASYVVITKLEEEYRLDTYLTCSGETKMVSEYLGCYNYCPTGVCEKTDDTKVCTETNITRYKFKRTLYKGQKVTKAGTTQYEYLAVKNVNYYQGTKSSTKTQYEQAEYTLNNTYKYNLYKEVTEPANIYLLEKRTPENYTVQTTEYKHVKESSTIEEEWIYDSSFVSYAQVGSAPANTNYVSTGATSIINDTDCSCEVTGYVYEVYKQVIKETITTQYVWRSSIQESNGWKYSGMTRVTTKVMGRVKVEQKASYSKSEAGWYYTNKYVLSTRTVPTYVNDVYEKDLQSYLDKGYTKLTKVGVTQKVATGKVVWSDTKTMSGNYYATGNTRVVANGSGTVTSDVVTDINILLNDGYKEADIKIVDTKQETYGNPVWLSTAGPVDGYVRTSTEPRVTNDDTVETTDYLTATEWNKKVSEGYTLLNTKVVYTTSLSSKLNGWTNIGQYTDVVKNCESVKK